MFILEFCVKSFTMVEAVAFIHFPKRDQINLRLLFPTAECFLNNRQTLVKLLWMANLMNKRILTGKVLVIHELQTFSGARPEVMMKGPLSVETVDKICELVNCAQTDCFSKFSTLKAGLLVFFLWLTLFLQFTSSFVEVFSGSNR